MAEKLPPCCARLASQLAHEEDNLRRLARKTAFAEQRGQSTTKLRAMMEKARASVRTTRAFLADHDAEHAA